ncbi:hypothetical protein F503_06048 [Ophiostoma piceae UAMH 11346]|uniref:Uncharacterized protein n=1 Tax=Ophiostoma piceae (strain UAMH 11346) TaxID=1262450 RepID=S3CW52_OPHP1|nr:hypothetical protein F503_06048 [Ophiostoma piceae UAMH 11346]
MASLSLFTGPMGLFADMASMQKTETTSAAPPTESAANTSSADTLAYRCHQSAVNAWSVAASAAKPLAWTASRAALIAVALADLVSQVACILASVALRAAYVLAALAARVANNTVLLARYAWACKRAERIRRKIYFEIALVLLGPGGSLLLIVLWPGWIVLAAAIWAVWAVV